MSYQRIKYVSHYGKRISSPTLLFTFSHIDIFYMAYIRQVIYTIFYLLPPKIQKLRKQERQSSYLSQLFFPFLRHLQFSFLLLFTIILLLLSHQRGTVSFSYELLPNRCLLFSFNIFYSFQYIIIYCKLFGLI